MRNPKWHRDEIILAPDLYFSPDRGPIDTQNPKIIQLSEDLNKLSIFPNKPNVLRFRNPNGIGLKLSNFLASDPTYDGKGMQSFSKFDKEVFEEFANDRQRLNVIVQSIREVLHDEPLLEHIRNIEEDENSILDTVQEGQVLYRLRKYQERNAKIMAEKKLVLKSTGKLTCEACTFDFFKTYDQLGWSFIECHHIKPIATYEAIAETKLDEVSAICANCHRMYIDSLGSLRLIS